MMSHVSTEFTMPLPSETYQVRFTVKTHAKTEYDVTLITEKRYPGHSNLAICRYPGHCQKFT